MFPDQGLRRFNGDCTGISNLKELNRRRAGFPRFAPHSLVGRLKDTVCLCGLDVPAVPRVACRCDLIVNFYGYLHSLPFRWVPVDRVKPIVLATTARQSPITIERPLKAVQNCSLP